MLRAYDLEPETLGGRSLRFRACRVRGPMHLEVLGFRIGFRV